jgi:ribose transport system permease protein
MTGQNEGAALASGERAGEAADRDSPITGSSESGPSVAAASAAPSTGRLGDIVERFALVIAWALVTAYFLGTEDAFRQPDTLLVILGAQSTQIIVTLAVVISLIGGEFDLSVANVLGASATGLVYLNVELHWPFLLALGAVLLMAVVYALINAVLIVKVGLPSIIVTLGAGTLLSGIWSGIAGTSPRNGASRPFVEFVGYKVFGLPVSFYLALLVGGILYYVLAHTPPGRHFTFAGRNRDVARLTGLAVNRLRVASLVAGSVLAAIAGLLLVGRTGAADPTTSGTYLLPAFAGAFLGTTAIRPGEFNIWGSFVAVYFLVTGVIGLQLAGFTGWVENVFYGGSLVIAVLFTQLIARHRGRTRGISLF